VRLKGVKEVEKHEQDKASCISQHDSHVNHRDSEVYNIRTSRFTVKRIKNTIKFLLFLEDDPQHHVWKDANNAVFAILISLALCIIPMPILYAFANYGVIGVALTLYGYVVALFEVFHCLFDR